jgi:hypothetical protein
VAAGKARPEEGRGLCERPQREPNTLGPRRSVHAAHRSRTFSISVRSKKSKSVNKATADFLWQDGCRDCQWLRMFTFGYNRHTRSSESQVAGRISQVSERKSGSAARKSGCCGLNSNKCFRTACSDICSRVLLFGTNLRPFWH